MLRSLVISLAFVLLLAGGMEATAQNGLLRRGDRSFNALSYLEAIAHYELAFERGAKSIAHARRLGESHWNLRNAEKAAPWYAMVAASSEATAEDLYRHAELLRASGHFEASDAWLMKFAMMSPNDTRGQRKDSSMEKLSALMDELGLAHKVMKAGFNSDRTDMAPFIQGDRIIFASARMPENLSKRHHTWNDQPFLNLYIGKLDEEGEVTDVKPMREGLNSGHHESNAIISHDGKELFFTRNNDQKSKAAGSEGVNNLQLYMRQKTGSGWSRDIPFLHNDPNYSYGHPALSKDGKRLYFTSDMPGGYGGRDIWVSERQENGKWGKPVNVGADINTEGDEMFPYMHGNYLFFASDGHLGFGGLDLFRVRLRSSGPLEPENLNSPINGPKDDFGICFNGPGDIGFFASDREGSIGGEDIYMFRTHSRPMEERVWMGRVMDEKTAQPVPHLVMQLIDGDRQEIDRAVTSEDGIYEFKDPGIPAFVSTTIPGGAHMEVPLEDIAVSKHGDTELPDVYLNSVMDLPVNAILRDAITDKGLEGVTVTVKDAMDGTTLFHGLTNEAGVTQGQIPDRRYGDDLDLDVTFSKPGYFTRTVRVDFRVLMFLEQVLAGPEESILTPMKLGADIGDAIGLRPIFFDRGDDEINENAAAELDHVVRVLQQDPTLEMEVRSHTDSRASTTFNDALSQRRSEITRNYLISKGIHQDRISAKGFGERRLLNRCKDGVECSEAEHHMNRRTEFIVTGCAGCRN